MASSAHTILVVDDDADIRDTLAEYLDYEGYRVACAANGRDALALLRDALRPCVILLDLMMPVMDGRTFRAEQLRDPALADIPVVVITAGGRPGDDSLAAPILPKPFDMSALMAMVGRYCRLAP